MNWKHMIKSCTLKPSPFLNDLTLRNILCTFRGCDSDESNILETFEMLMYLWLKIQDFFLTTICFKPKPSLPCISWTLGFYQKWEVFFSLIGGKLT